MKKTLLLAITACMGMAAFAQTQVQNFVRTMPCTNDLGQVIATQFGTICLPYVPQVEGAKLYQLVSASSTEWIFQEVTNPEANTPYVFRVEEGASEVVFKGEGEYQPSEHPVAAAAGVEGAFIASYKREVIRNQKMYYLANDRINCNEGAAVMSTPCRAYFAGNVMPEGEQLSDDVKITFIQAASNRITNVDAADNDAVMIGRQNLSLQPGKYSINGKKAIVK